MFVLLVYPLFNIKVFNIVVNLLKVTKDIIINFTQIIHESKKLITLN